METAYTTTEGTREMSENEQQVKPTEHPSEPPAKILRSEEIFEGRRQIFIAHGTEIYRLLHTKNGKLILQK